MSSAPPDRLIGILGGTFDPIHIGHLRLAIEMRERISLDHVRLIPVSVPNHRALPVASSAQRLAMLRAVTDEYTLCLDTREIDRPGVSYMVDTLTSLRQDFPESGFGLILGYDAYCGLSGWHQWQRLFELCHILVANRPNSGDIENDALKALTEANRVDDPKELRESRAGRVHFQSIPALSVSSSDIRRRYDAGLDVRYLMPAGVQAIVDEEKLYRDNG